MKTPARFLVVLLAVAGCAPNVHDSQPLSPPAQPPVTPVVKPLPQPAPTPDKRVVIDASLERAVQVVKIKSEPGAEGFLRIPVDVINPRDAPRQFSYCIEGRDGAGAVLPQVGNGFLSWMLRGRETSSIAATAPTAVAKDFRITFISAAN